MRAGDHRRLLDSFPALKRLSSLKGVSGLGWKLLPGAALHSLPPGLTYLPAELHFLQVEQRQE